MTYVKSVELVYGNALLLSREMVKDRKAPHYITIYYNKNPINFFSTLELPVSKIFFLYVTV
jgi:hypothetical protein